MSGPQHDYNGIELSLVLMKTRSQWKTPFETLFGILRMDGKTSLSVKHT